MLVCVRACVAAAGSLTVASVRASVCVCGLVCCWQLLESALPRQANRAITDAAKDLRRHLFGGVSADVTVCSHCGFVRPPCCVTTVCSF